ncbi:unnamed protein product [Brachionus calyciflorus]|uniref:Uncharacterized protein n=1 Tax=Brachionus calyciflorus TaxID=104777 RepID=A0A813YWS2_9BILA|nr:unnamed protein product [Brachionus calyciflorus]
MSTFEPGVVEVIKESDSSRIYKLWYQMFLVTLISSVICHSIGSLVLFFRLRSHHYAKWLALIVQITGFITPIFLGTISNLLIASILVFSNRHNLSFFIVTSIGLAQTLCIVAVEFLKIMQTL